MIAMPTGTGDGIFMCRLSSLEKVVEALHKNWEKYEKQENK